MDATPCVHLTCHLFGCGPTTGGACTAAAFLQEFVDPETPWVRPAVTFLARVE